MRALAVKAASLPEPMRSAIAASSTSPMTSSETVVGSQDESAFPVPLDELSHKSLEIQATPVMDSATDELASADVACQLATLIGGSFVPVATLIGASSVTVAALIGASSVTVATIIGACFNASFSNPEAALAAGSFSEAEAALLIAAASFDGSGLPTIVDGNRGAVGFWFIRNSSHSVRRETFSSFKLCTVLASSRTVLLIMQSEEITALRKSGARLPAFSGVASGPPPGLVKPPPPPLGGSSWSSLSSKGSNPLRRFPKLSPTGDGNGAPFGGDSPANGATAFVVSLCVLAPLGGGDSAPNIGSVHWSSPLFGGSEGMAPLPKPQPLGN